jgi:hypothetical protein
VNFPGRNSYSRKAALENRATVTQTVCLQWSGMQTSRTLSSSILGPCTTKISAKERDAKRSGLPTDSVGPELVQGRTGDSTGADTLSVLPPLEGSCVGFVDPNHILSRCLNFSRSLAQPLHSFAHHPELNLSQKVHALC